MAIPNPNPKTVPASNEKTFNSLWVLNMRVRAPNGIEGSIVFDTCPYDEVSGEMLDNETKRTFVNLWEAVAEVPEAAQAMGAVFASVPAILAWQEAKNNPPQEEPTP